MEDQLNVDDIVDSASEEEDKVEVMEAEGSYSEFDNDALPELSPVNPHSFMWGEFIMERV